MRADSLREEEKEKEEEESDSLLSLVKL